MPVTSPVSERLTVTGLLLLTFATGLVDAISVLVLGHVFVANMTGNVIFLGFWFVPHSGVDMTAAVVATLSILAGAGVLRYHDNTKLILIAGLAIAFGSQNATARQFVLTMCAGAVVGATMSRFAVAPVIALAAALVAATAVIFLFGPQVTTATDD